MNKKDPKLALLEREVRASLNNLDDNCLWINNEREVDYLMGGRSTELIDSILISYSNEIFYYAKLYGVVAADQQKGRYCWIYLHYKRNIWKCYSIKRGFEIAKKLFEHEKLEQKLSSMQRRVEKQRRLQEKRNAALALN